MISLILYSSTFHHHLAKALYLLLYPDTSPPLEPIRVYQYTLTYSHIRHRKYIFKIILPVSQFALTQPATTQSQSQSQYLLHLSFT